MVEPGDNVIILSERLSKRSAEILTTFLRDIALDGLQEGLVQDHALATFTPILTKEMGKIDWSKSGEEILRQVKALVSWPTAYTFLDGLLLKIFEGTFKEDMNHEGSSPVPGTILEISKEGIHVRTGSVVFVIKELQLQNKNRMRAYDFTQGYRGLESKVLKKD
jgi:methionyl-tRNA formyltransferase